MLRLNIDEYKGVVIAELTRLAGVLFERLPPRVKSLEILDEKLIASFRAVGERDGYEYVCRAFVDECVVVECTPGIPQLALGFAALAATMAGGVVARLESSPGKTRVYISDYVSALKLVEGSLTQRIFTFYRPRPTGHLFVTSVGQVIGDCMLEGCEASAIDVIKGWEGEDTDKVIRNLLKKMRG